MRRGKPLGNLNWITKRFYLMSATDKDVLHIIRMGSEYSYRSSNLQGEL